MATRQGIHRMLPLASGLSLEELRKVYPVEPLRSFGTMVEPGAICQAGTGQHISGSKFYTFGGDIGQRLEICPLLAVREEPLA